MAYITVSDYRRRYPDTTSTDEEMLIEIQSVTETVSEYCNTRFKPTTDEYTLDFGYKFYTKKAPLIGVTALSLNGVALSEDIDFYVYPEKRVIEIDEYIEKPQKYKKSILIQYVYGYKAVPQIVKDVVIDLVNLNYNISIGELSDVDFQSETWDGEYSYTKPAGTSIRRDILSRLDPYVVQDICYLPTLDLEEGNITALIL